MKTNEQNLHNKSTRTTKDLVLVSLLSTSEVYVLRIQSNIYIGAFFAIQRTKAKSSMGSKYASQTLSRFYLD